MDSGRAGRPLAAGVKSSVGGRPAKSDLAALRGADFRLQDVDDTLRDGVEHANKERGGLLEEAEEISEQELEDEVYQELSFMLCSRCRKRFARDPFNRGARTYRTTKNFERIFH